MPVLFQISRSHGRTAALPDNQTAFPDLAEIQSFSSGADGRKLRHSTLAVIEGMQIHCRQRRIQEGSEKLIVTANQRHILRHTDAHTVQLMQCAQRNQVIDSNQRRGASFPGRPGEQLRHAQLSCLGCKACFSTHICKGRQPPLFHLIEESRLPNRRRPHRGAAANKGNAPMA